MKRKINQVGTGTLTVSLPSKWVRSNNLKKGDEIEIEEKGTTLTMGAEQKPRKLEIKIDVSDQKIMLNRIIAAIYKAGFDLANVSFATPEQLKIIQDTIYRACQAYEIMGVKKNIIEIKSISELDIEQFDQMFRKLAQTILMISKETYDAIKNKNYEQLSNIILKDQMIDRYSDFCRRTINKGYTPSGIVSPLYSIIEQTEAAADIFKVICNETIGLQGNIDADILDFFRGVVKVIEKFYNMLFDFNLEKVREFGELEEKIRGDINLICKKQRKNIKILVYMIYLFEMIFEMKSVLLTLNLRNYTTKQ